jgi:hypothetical protein
MTENEVEKWLHFAKRMEMEFPKNMLSNTMVKDSLKSKVLSQAKDWGYSKEHKIPKNVWKTLQNEHFYRVARIIDLNELVDFGGKEADLYIKHSGNHLKIENGKIVLPEKGKKTIFDY